MTVIAADQSRTQTVEVRSGNGTLLSRAVNDAGGRRSDRLRTSTPMATALSTRLRRFVRNASGQTIETSTQFSANGVMLARSVATTSADGLSTTPGR